MDHVPGDRISREGTTLALLLSTEQFPNFPVSQIRESLEPGSMPGKDAILRGDPGQEPASALRLGDFALPQFCDQCHHALLVHLAARRCRHQLVKADLNVSGDCAEAAVGSRVSAAAQRRGQ